MKVHKKIPLRVFYRKNLFPNCNMEIPENSKGQNPLKPGDFVAVMGVRYYFQVLVYRKSVITLARVEKKITSKGLPMVEIRGFKRGNIVRKDGFYHADCTVLVSPEHSDQSGLEVLRKKAQEFVFLINIPESDKLIYLMNFILTVGELTDFIAHYFITDYKKREKLLKCLSVKERQIMLLDILKDMIKNVHKKVRVNV